MLRQLQILTPEEVTEASQLLSELEFGDPGNLHPGQTSTEAIRDQNAVKLGRLAVAGLERDRIYKNFVLGRQIDRWLISKTEVGQEFRVHQDNPEVGEYSVSVFLNDDFEGGELCVKPDHEVFTFKPKAGTAIVYDIGLPHRVAPVTKGTRYVMVFWIRSFCTDPAMREALGSLLQAYSLMRDEQNITDWSSFEEAEKDPQFWLTKGINRLIQQYAPGYN